MASESTIESWKDLYPMDEQRHVAAQLQARAAPLTYLVAEAEKELYGDKVVLCFEGNATLDQACSWIAAYNQSTDHSFSLHEQLINSLYVVQVRSPNPAQSIAALLAKSLLFADGTFATVNPFSSDFNPCNPTNFKQLVSVTIKEGSALIFRFLDPIFEAVGKVVSPHLASGLEQHKITFLLETTLKTFPPEVTFDVSPTRSQLIPVEYGQNGLPLRCSNCFAYEHSAAECARPISDPTHLHAPVSGPIPSKPTRPAPNYQPSSAIVFTCNACGSATHPFRECPIPSIKLHCDFCKKKGHIGTVCFQKHPERKPQQQRPRLRRQQQSATAAAVVSSCNFNSTFPPGAEFLPTIITEQPIQRSVADHRPQQQHSNLHKSGDQLVQQRFNLQKSGGSLVQQNSNLAEPGHRLVKQHSNPVKAGEDFVQQNPNLEMVRGHLVQQNPKLAEPGHHLGNKQHPNLAKAGLQFPRGLPEGQQPQGSAADHQLRNLLKSSGHQPLQQNPSLSEDGKHLLQQHLNVANLGVQHAGGPRATYTGTYSAPNHFDAVKAKGLLGTTTMGSIRTTSLLQLNENASNQLQPQQQGTENYRAPPPLSTLPSPRNYPAPHSNYPASGITKPKAASSTPTPSLRPPQIWVPKSPPPLIDLSPPLIDLVTTLCASHSYVEM